MSFNAMEMITTCRDAKLVFTFDKYNLSMFGVELRFGKPGPDSIRTDYGNVIGAVYDLETEGDIDCVTETIAHGYWAGTHAIENYPELAKTLDNHILNILWLRREILNYR